MKTLRAFCNSLQKLPAFGRGVCVFKKGFAFCREPNEAVLDGVDYHVSASSKSTRSGRTGSSPMTVCM